MVLAFLPDSFRCRLSAQIIRARRSWHEQNVSSPILIYQEHTRRTSQSALRRRDLSHRHLSSDKAPGALQKR